MTLYEFNQAGYNALPKMTKAEKAKAAENIKKYLSDTLGEFYMLLSNDLHYYTIFTWKDFSSEYDDMVKEIMSIAEELGVIKSIEVNENGAIEFWISNNEECHMYVLFNYTHGVIKV